MDNVFAQIKTTELKGSTFRSRILDFGDFDISEAEFKIVFKRAGNILSFPYFIPQKVGNTLVIPYNILESYSGEIRMEAWMSLNGITDLAMVDTMLISAENSLKSDATNQNISVTFGDVVIPVTFTQAIVNIGGGNGIGENGKSAYEIAVLNGFPGTEGEWLISLKGADGEDFTFEDFTPEQLALLKGEKGDSFEYADFTPEQLALLKGAAGKSAYQVALDNGFVGTEPEWLASLQGQDADAIDIGLEDISGIKVFSNGVIVNGADCTWVDGKYILLGGTIGTLSTFSYCSNYIPVQGLSRYRFKSLGVAIAWYDLNKEFIGLGGSSSDAYAERTFISPPNAKFCRVNQLTANIPNFILYADDLPSVDIPELKVSKSQVIGLEQTPDLQNRSIVKSISGSFDFTQFPVAGNIIISGDSTIGTHTSGAAIATIIKATGTITNIALSGDTIAQQLTAWNNLTETVRTECNYVFVQIGLNDLDNSKTATATINALQSYINKIKTDSPNVKIILGTLTPCRKRLVNFYGVDGWERWKSVNYFIENWLILKVNSVASLHTYLLSDPNGNLATEFDSGDFIHENISARKIIAYSWLSAYMKIR